MKFTLKAAGAAMLAASLVASSAYASGKDAAPAKKHTAARRTKAAKPSVDDQIQALRQDLEHQINGLKSDLAAKDAQLQQAQQAAADAQSAAAKAEAAAASQGQAVSDNAEAVNKLQATVDDVKNTNALAVGSLSDDQAAIRKSIANPEALNFKGITLSFSGSFIAAETSYRTAAVGADVNTPMTGIPLTSASQYQIGEFYGSGRQSRLAFKGQGKTDYGTFTGYYEMDWLGAGVTSNNNQSNSYVMRQRQIWLEAALNRGWTVSGGQMWSLATETAKGTSNGSEATPSTIDAQYNAGFVWGRQYGLRVSKQIGRKFWLAGSIENAQTLNAAGTINLGTNTVLLGNSAGVTGGLYNNQATYSYNLTPDVIVKAVVEPGWGHWEFFGIERNFRDRIYPGGSTTGAYNDTEVGGGVGGSMRGALISKKLTIGLKGLYGYGVGRYGNSTIGDITLKPTGIIEPLQGFSALSTVEAAASKKLTIWANYGGDYIYRDILSTNDGYGLYTASMTGCGVEAAAGTSTTGQAGSAGTTNCAGNNKDVQELSVGYWFNFFNGPKGRVRQGFQYSYIRRDLWSGVGGTANPSGKGYGDDNMIFTSLRYYLP